MNYNSLKDAIAQVIGSNDNQEITGQVLQNVLHTMINALANGYIFAGVATPATSPGNPDQNVFWIGGPGSYANFGEPVFEVPSYGIAVFIYNGSFTREVISFAVDNTPTENSNNLITSGAVASAINILKKVRYVSVNNLDSLFNANDLGIYLVYEGTELAIVGILSVFTHHTSQTRFIHQVLLSNYINVDEVELSFYKITILTRYATLGTANSWSSWKDYQRGKADTVELTDYMTNNAVLPSLGNYVWYGNSVESRVFTKDESGTTAYYQVFARSRGDFSANGFGIIITDCALYVAGSNYGPYTFVAHYQGNNIPDFVLKAFGKSVATTTSDGLLSKEDKETLDKTAARIDVYNVNYHQSTEYGYTLASAIALVPEAKRHIGMVVTYRKYGTDNEWESKQFVGGSISGWTTESNWVDFGDDGLASSAIEDVIDTTNILDPSYVDKSRYKYISISSGNVVNSSNPYYVTDYIPFTSNGMYINGWAGYGSIGWALYDSNKSHISGAGGKTNIVEYQEGAAYIRITLNANEESTWMLSEGTTPKDYVAYHAHIISIKENVNVPQIESVQGIADENSEKLSAAFDFQRDNTNILAPDMVDETSYKYISINTGALTNTQYEAYATDFIPITSAGAYILGLYGHNVFGWALYDEDKQYITGGITNAVPYVEGAVLLRATLRKSEKSQWMICNGTTPRSYVPYNYLQPIPKFNLPDDLLSKTFGNRTFVILGDSSMIKGASDSASDAKWTRLFENFVSNHGSVVYNGAVGGTGWHDLQDQWDGLKANITVDDPIIIIGSGGNGTNNYIDYSNHTNQAGIYIDYSENKSVLNYTYDKVINRCFADTSAKLTILDAAVEFMKGLLKEYPKAIIFFQNNWVHMQNYMETQDFDGPAFIYKRRKLKEFHEALADFFGCAIVDVSRANIHGFTENYTIDNGSTYPYRWAAPGDGLHISGAEGKERVFRVWVGTLMQYLMKV